MAAVYERPKLAAAKLGIPLEELLAQVRARRKWCPNCERWVSRKAYSKNKARKGGYNSKCKACTRKADNRARRTLPGTCGWCGKEKLRLVPFGEWLVCKGKCLEDAKKLEA